ncbi:conserved Plasmodium protein, unknown function [Plasmodium relictum]|uniref:Uncharacterized protein n=1 Tax=Plasmodium relictum TaxID=85471 RepID=A0A1J1H2C1_PLARL|nr:conserved Plasmodium protein, unknown function [Plasmodium relictum]CRG99003.1 conserved Plasmodium protein, unknown function [Plasmodium relictum]
MKNSSLVFSEKFNKHFIEKKKREDNLNEEKREKEIFFNIDNFKVKINDEGIKDINVILEEKKKYIRNQIGYKMEDKKKDKEVNNNESKIDNEIEYDVENTFSKNNCNNEYVDKKKIKRRNIEKENRLGNSTINKNEKVNDNKDLHDIINDPFIKIKKLKLKLSTRYLGKNEDLSYNILKEYHTIINNCIDEIKRETFIESNLLKKNVETLLNLIKNYIKEIANFKWNGNGTYPLNSSTMNDNYAFSIKYYENIMNDNIYDTVMLYDNNVNTIENTKKNLVDEMKKNIEEKKHKTKERWIIIQNLFTKLNENIKIFISNFEKKHESCMKIIDNKTQELEKKLKEKIFFSNNELTDIINKEIKNNKSFFLEFLNYFNDYIMKIYNYVYMKYSESESIFFDIFNEHKYQDNFYIFSMISENYINNLSNDKVLNCLLKLFEDNYDSTYKKRTELKKEEYFYNFFFLESYHDFYSYLNIYYEEYIKIYNEIKVKTICYRDIVIYIFFDIQNFLTIINFRAEKKNNKKEKNNKEVTYKVENNKKKEKKKKNITNEKHIIYSSNSETNYKKKKSNNIPKTENVNSDENYFNSTTLLDNLDLTLEHNNDINRIVKNDFTKENKNINIKNRENILHLNKNIFEKSIENILNYYNIINLRDDFLFLAFFEFLEKLKNDTLILHSEIEKKIKKNIYYCEKESCSLKENFHLVFNEYNENVKKCLRCKDYNELHKLLLIHDEIVKNLEYLIESTNEKIENINDKLLMELKEYSSNYFFSILKKSKIIVSDEESIISKKKTKKMEYTCNEKDNSKLIKEKENDNIRKNNKVTKEKKTKKIEYEYKNIKAGDEINGEQVNLKNICDYNKENEINIINQIINKKYKYIYDISNIILLTYHNYKYNIKNILYSCNNNISCYSYLKIGKKRKTKNGNVENYYTKQKNTILKDIKYIKEKIFQNIKQNKENKNEKQDNYKINSNICDNILLGSALNYDNILFNLNNMHNSFEIFINNYYEYFKNNLFEFLLKIKMNIESQEYTKYFKRIESDKYKKEIKMNNVNIYEVKISLEKKFLKNKEIYNNYAKKLKEYVNEYESIMKDSTLEKNFKSSIKKVDKLFLEKIDSCEDFNKKYILFFEKFKDSYNAFNEKLQNMINNLNKEIKKLEKYLEMVVKIKEKNVDIETIRKDLQNSNTFLLSLVKKKNDMNNLYNANTYIFNNKIKIKSKSDIMEIKYKIPSDNEMIKYLSIKEEIKNNILIFYVLIFYIKTHIFNKKYEKKKNEKKKKIENENVASLSLTSNIKESKFKSTSTYNTNSNNEKNSNDNKINIESKFKQIENYIYNVSIFQKIKKIYELDIKNENSFLNNFLIFLKFSENINNLIFSKKNMYTYKDNLINFHIYDEKYNNKKEREENITSIIICDNEIYNNKSKINNKNDSNDSINNSDNSKKKNNNNKTIYLGKKKLLDKEKIKTTNNIENKKPKEKMDIPKNIKEKNIKVSEYKPIESKEDMENYIKNAIIRNYCNLKFFLYTCVYIIYLICKIIKIYDYNIFIEDEKYNHFLFISYDLSYTIYKNSILKENKLKNKIYLKDLKLDKKSKSSFIYLPNHILYKIELTNLFNFEKKLISDLYEKYFNQIKSLPPIDENSKNFKKLQNEYMHDISILVTYLKVLSKKMAYLIFSYAYKYHEELISERINNMQTNFKLKFQKISEQFKLTIDDNIIITKRKKELKSLMELYLLCIKNILENHLYSLYENLYNNFIYFVYLLNLLPSNSFVQSFNSKENNESNKDLKIKNKGLGNFLKINYFDNSTEYDLSDLTKKIRKVYDLNYDEYKNENKKININNNANKEVFYMEYIADNSYIVKKLEKKIEKYMSKYYTHITKNLDEKKKEIIKMISNDKKLHRKYYE